MMNDFAEDELPLPSFVEIFGDGVLIGPKKKKKHILSGGKLDGLCGEETTGRWTPDEHRLFLEGIMLYGKDWKKMQPLIKTRTLVQIRTHAQKVFKKIGLKKIGAGKRRPILPAQKKRKGEDGEDLDDDLDDTELENIGLHIDGVDDAMLAAMSPEKQQQLANLQQQAVNMHFVGNQGMSAAQQHQLLQQQTSMSHNMGMSHNMQHENVQGQNQYGANIGNMQPHQEAVARHAHANHSMVQSRAMQQQQHLHQQQMQHLQQQQQLQQQLHAYQMQQQQHQLMLEQAQAGYGQQNMYQHQHHMQQQQQQQAYNNAIQHHQIANEANMLRMHGEGSYDAIYAAQVGVHSSSVPADPTMNNMHTNNNFGG